MATSKDKSGQKDGDWVLTPYFKHWRTGQIVRRKDGGMFPFPSTTKKIRSVEANKGGVLA